MNALGESSLGISNIGQFQEDKTATEVRALVEQQTARDNYNQIYLSEALKRMMKLWYSQNQKMLFNDPEHKWMVVRIVGHEAIKYFQEAGLDDDIVIDETIDMVRERTLIAAMEGRSEEIIPWKLLRENLRKSLKWTRLDVLASLLLKLLT